MNSTNFDESHLVSEGRNRQRMRFLQEHVPVALVESDLQGRVTFWSKSAEHLFGWTQSEVLGRSVRDISLVHPDDVASAYRVAQDMLHSRSSFAFTRNRNLTKDGRTLHCGWYISLLVDSEGQPISYFSLALDETAEKVAEDRVRRGDARQLEYLAMLSHELRNPLAPMRHATRLLRDGNNDPELRTRSLETLERQIEKMSRYLDGLLDVSRINYGRFDLRLAPVRLLDVIDAAIETAMPVIEEKKQQLVGTLEILRDVTIQADAVRLEQVFINLLTNASRYSERRRTIRIEAEQHEANLSVSVIDQGIGIGPESFPVLFDLFYQRDQESYAGSQGLGVGLFLASRIVQLHHGRLDAQSPGIGQGATFTVSLPICQAKAESTPPTIRSSRQHRSHRILVVDDYVATAHSLGEVLRMLGQDVRVAFSGHEACRVAADFHPNLVLLDIGLPDIDGYEVARRLKLQGEDAQIIAVTGWGPKEKRLHDDHAPIDRFITKPMSDQTLDEILDGLDQHEQRDPAHPGIAVAHQTEAPAHSNHGKEPENRKHEARCCRE